MIKSDVMQKLWEIADDIQDLKKAINKSKEMKPAQKEECNKKLERAFVIIANLETDMKFHKKYDYEF